jgi:hypothetical protein
MGFFTNIKKTASDLAVEVLPDDIKEGLSHLKHGNLDGVKKVGLWLCHSPTASGLRKPAVGAKINTKQQPVLIDESLPAV